MRCVTFWIGLLLVSDFSSAVFGATKPVFPEDETEEQRYWREHHAREAEIAKREQELQNERAQQIKAAVEGIVDAGAAVQPTLLEAERKAAEAWRIANPPPPSALARNRDNIIFGIFLIVAGGIALNIIQRQRRAAELNILTGKYLTDETEAAWDEMPELFAPAHLFARRAPDLTAPIAEAQEQVGPMVDPREAFFRAFPTYMSAMREALQEIGAATAEAEKQKQLADMAELIAAFKIEANLWQLRPILQISTVLELLLKQLAQKTKDATPSALRTVAGAIDLLADLAVPDLSPDLLVVPPLQILAVDDEPLCLRAVTFALEKANFTPDLARDGLEAVMKANEKRYDVIFMDIQMPELDGIEACTQIREGSLNANTPVVFVTAHSDFNMRAKSTLAGGSELIAKPFLIFELTMKAVTYAARKRLHRHTRNMGIIPNAPPPRATTPAKSAEAPVPRVNPEKQDEPAAA